MKQILLFFLLLSTVTACYSQSFKKGNRVDVKWNANTWYPATIVDVNATQYKVRLDDAGDDGDQWVSKDKLRMSKTVKNDTSPNGMSNEGVAAKTTKKRVEVNVRAYWYKATVLQQKGDTYFVKYDGYPDSDNQWVHKSQIRDLNESGVAVTVACSFGPPPGHFTNASPASDALFKREIYDYYARTVNGTLSRPTRVGVVFTAYSRGAAYKNTVTNVPGQGATRRHEGAPVNATIYPVATTYFVCEEYADGVTQKQVNTNFSFFINKDGEWTCSKDN